MAGVLSAAIVLVINLAYLRVHAQFADCTCSVPRRQNDQNTYIHIYTHRRENIANPAVRLSASVGLVSEDQGPEDSLSAVAGPSMMDKVISGMSNDLLELLGKGTTVELWYENRYASLERYLSFLVLFHAMAERVANFYPLKFDIWRSQSQLRVATTAAPIRYVCVFFFA
jgi:hypothetical protein